MIHEVCTSLVQIAGGGRRCRLTAEATKKKGSRGGTRHLSTRGRDQRGKQDSGKQLWLGEGRMPELWDSLGGR